MRLPVSARLFGSAAGAALVLPISQAEAAQRRFDGPWAIEIMTERGACDPLYRYYVVVDGETVRVRTMFGETAHSAAGLVRPNGVINLRIGQASDPLTVRGRLGPDAGAGVWSAPARGCRGGWRAQRRQA